MHLENSFITLIYSDDYLPSDGSLSKREWVLFMKRLRKAFPDKKIRFFMCGEYGENFARPHYHACLFGLDFPDKELWSVRDSVKLYRSPILETLWPYGHSTIGDVTFDSAAYVARYITKKITGDVAAIEDHYGSTDLLTGEWIFRQPEFILMSRGDRKGSGGIGKSWREKYKSDLEKDFITLRGVRMKPAKYYDRLFDIENPEVFHEYKLERRKKAARCEIDNTSKRLAVREKIHLKRSKLLKRGFENEA